VLTNVTSTTAAASGETSMSTTSDASTDSSTDGQSNTTASTTSTNATNISTTAAASGNATTPTASATESATTTAKAGGNVTTTTASATESSTTAAAYAITSFKSKLALKDASDFDQAQYLQSVAQAAGVDLSTVQVKSLVYVVAVQYSVPSGISESDFAASVAESVGVAVDKVAVTFSKARRLVGGGRRLQDVLADVEISTEDSAATSVLSTKANDATALTSALEAVTGGPVTLTVSKAPSLSVIVETQVTSPTVTPVQAPSSSDLASSLSTITGKEIAVDVIDVQMETITATTTEGDTDPMPSKSVKTVSAGSVGSISLLMLAACVALQ